jgi:hypothetical protein
VWLHQYYEFVSSAWYRKKYFVISCQFILHTILYNGPIILFQQWKMYGPTNDSGYLACEGAKVWLINRLMRSQSKTFCWMNSSVSRHITIRLDCDYTGCTTSCLSETAAAKRAASQTATSRVYPPAAAGDIILPPWIIAFVLVNAFLNQPFSSVARVRYTMHSVCVQCSSISNMSLFL